MYLFSLIVIFKITKLLAVFLNVPLGKWGRGVPVMLLVLFFGLNMGVLGVLSVWPFIKLYIEKGGGERERTKEKRNTEQFKWTFKKNQQLQNFDADMNGCSPLWSAMIALHLFPLFCARNGSRGLMPVKQGLYCLATPWAPKLLCESC